MFHVCFKTALSTFDTHASSNKDPGSAFPSFLMSVNKKHCYRWLVAGQRTPTDQASPIWEWNPGHQLDWRFRRANWRRGSTLVTNSKYPVLCAPTFYWSKTPRVSEACTLLFPRRAPGNHARKVRKHRGCCEVFHWRFVDRFKRLFGVCSRPGG